MKILKNKKAVEEAVKWVMYLLVGLGFLYVAYKVIFGTWGKPTISLLKSFFRMK